MLGIRLLSRLLVLLLLAQMSLAADKSLSARIDRILDDPDAARGVWGIEVVSLTTGKVLYSENGDKLFTPASDTKLFTTAAALALIGPDYKFHTTVVANGSLDKHGRLTGDLVLVGRGDPNISGRTLPYRLKTERNQPPLYLLEELADQVVQRGLKVVDGDVVADDTYYAFERYGEGWTQDDLVWEWGAPVSAMTVNDNVVFISILPADRVGERAFVTTVPSTDYYRLDNRIRTTAAGTGPRKIYISREPGSTLLTLWGNIPADDPGANEALAIEDPADFAARAFRSMLQQRGVTVYGRSRSRHNELADLRNFPAPTVAYAGGGEEKPPSVSPSSNSLVLAEHVSQPLIDDLQVINKVSQNLHAELLLRLLGREKGSSGTIEAGLEVLRGFLTQAGIHSDEYVFYDGSGLSRENLVTPHAMTKLLTWADTQPWGKEYEETLPVAGIDGSLAGRFKASMAEGQVLGKTGSLGHVNSLAGYATTVRGERLAFVIIVNNHMLSSTRVLMTIDSIVEAMVQDGSKK